MSKKNSILLALSVFIIISMVSFTGYKMHEHQQKEGPKFADTWNSGRVDATNLPIGSNDIVFVGTSLTEGFMLSEIFNTTQIKNRGINGNQTKHILQRIDVIALQHPKAIFLEAGINDIIKGVDSNWGENNYTETINHIQKISPHTTIYIQAIPPVFKTYAQYANQVAWYNNFLMQLSKQRGITFINTYAIMDSTCNYDGLHLNHEGYRRWALAINSNISELTKHYMLNSN